VQLPIKERVFCGEVIVSVFLAVGGVDDLAYQAHPIIHYLLLFILLHWLKIKLLLATVDSESEMVAFSGHSR
jgi:hypothetical protein